MNVMITKRDTKGSAVLPGLLAVVVAITVLGGCASWVQPTPAEVAAADYGPVPNAEQVVSNYIAETFFDPHAVQDLTIEKPRKLWWIAYEQHRYRPPAFGYLVEFSCNAKNRLGGYLGRRTHRLFVRDGTVKKDWLDDDWAANRTWIGFGPAS